MKIWPLIFITLGFVLGCQTQPKSFFDDKDAIVHKPTGLKLPKEVKNWTTSEDARSENLTPEILASIFYTSTVLQKDITPQARVYILKNKSTANLQLIENYSMSLLTKPQKVKTENLRLPSRKRVTATVFTHESEVSQSTGGVSILKKYKAESVFAQSKAQPNLVFWLTYDRNADADKKAALQFMDDYLRK